MLVARPATTGQDHGSKNVIAGFIVSRVIAGELHINNVAVRPDFQRRGIAGKLLSTLLAQGRKQGAHLAFLEVRAGNDAAQGLYRRSGFEVTGRRRRYYNDPLEDALLMSLTLETLP
jgi:ribosomal-protein-alanine N-acetyltransferase